MIPFYTRVDFLQAHPWNYHVLRQILSILGLEYAKQNSSLFLNMKIILALVMQWLSPMLVLDTFKVVRIQCLCIIIIIL